MTEELLTEEKFLDGRTCVSRFESEFKYQQNERQKRHHIKQHYCEISKHREKILNVSSEGE